MKLQRHRQIFFCVSCFQISSRGKSQNRDETSFLSIADVFCQCKQQTPCVCVLSKQVQSVHFCKNPTTATFFKNSTDMFSMKRSQFSLSLDFCRSLLCHSRFYRPQVLTPSGVEVARNLIRRRVCPSCWWIRCQMHRKSVSTMGVTHHSLTSCFGASWISCRLLTSNLCQADFCAVVVSQQWFLLHKWRYRFCNSICSESEPLALLEFLRLVRVSFLVMIWFFHKVEGLLPRFTQLFWRGEDARRKKAKRASFAQKQNLHNLARIQKILENKRKIELNNQMLACSGYFHLKKRKAMHTCRSDASRPVETEGNLS